MKLFIKKNKWPLAIFLAAFLIRLIYLIQYRSNPAFYYPMVDELWNLNWAKEITGGNFWGDEAYFRGPLYPYLLAFFLKLTGSSIFWSRFLQIIIASFSAVLVYVLGEKAFSKKAGIFAGLAYAVYGTIIFYETMLLIPAIFIFLNLLAVYLMLLFKGRYKLRFWFLAGIIVGLSAIARPNILLLAPFFMLWIFAGFSQLKEIRKRFFVILIYLVGILIPVFSVTLRNYLVTSEAILISSQGGVNFYIGNNPETEGLTMLMPEVQLNESLPWSKFTDATRKAAEDEVGKKLTAAEESSFWTKKALKFIWNNPGKFIGTTFRKIIYFFVGFENSDQTDIYYSRTYSSLFSILLWKKPLYFPWGLIFPLALIGMLAGWSKRNELSLFYIFIIGYIPTVILFLVTARHRLAIIPFMLLFAASGSLALWKFFREKNWRKISGYGALLAVLLVLCNRTYFDIGFENTFQIHFNLALTYDRQGNMGMAEDEYREAIKVYPYSAVALTNLGFLLHNQERNDEALSMFQRAIQADPDYAEAYNNAGLVFESRKDYLQAENYYKKAASIDPDLFQAYVNLGDVFLARNDFTKSEQYYLKAKNSAPDSKEVFFKLGALYARKGEFTRAEGMFLNGRKLGEPAASDYVNWGNIYFSTRRPERAIELYRKAITKDTLFTQAYFNLALAFNNFGLPVDSAGKYLEMVLRIDPGFEPARELLQQIRRD